MNDSKNRIHFLTPKKIAVGAVIVFILGLTVFQFQYLAAARIENALAVEPQSINFGFILPATAQVKQLAVSLNEAWLESGRTEAVGYRISKKPKCSSWDENGVCADHFLDLCPFLSSNPVSGALIRTDPTGIVGVVLNYPSGEPLAPELLGRRFWCELWVQVSAVSPENPNPGGGDSSATSTPPNTESLLPFLPPLAKIIESFPAATARAFEAHIVEVSAVFLSGSPAQVAVAPVVEPSFMKNWATEISNIRHDPKVDAGLATLTMATAVSCLAPEPFATKVWCAGSLLLTWGAKEIMWASYDLLALDPPREDVDVVERVKPAKPARPFDNSAFAATVARYATSLARHSQFVDAARITNERLQGAVIADSGEYILLQGRLLYEFLGRLAESNAHHQDVIRQLSHQLVKVWSEDISQRVAGWASEGLSDEEIQAFLNSGLSEEEVATIEKIFSHASGVAQSDYFGTLQAGLQKEIELMQGALPAIEQESSILEKVIESLESVVCTGQTQTDACL